MTLNGQELTDGRQRTNIASFAGSMLQKGVLLTTIGHQILPRDLDHLTCRSCPRINTKSYIHLWPKSSLTI